MAIWNAMDAPFPNGPNLLRCDAAFKGNGPAMGNSEAAKWYRLAAEQGDPTAQANLRNLSDWMATSNATVAKGS
jgi:TPR repeat protein